MKDIDTLIVEKMLKISAIKLQPDAPFVWATGWNSPIYTDNRLTLSYPEVRNLIKVESARVIMEQYGEAEVIAGVATGAIAHGALVADSLGLPMVYVRPTPKDHGLENQIEGDIKPGQKVVLIEDQLSTGNNCMKAYNAVRDAGGDVIGIVVVFNYQFEEAAKALKKAHLKMTALTDFGALLKVAKKAGISPEVITILKQWHEDPASWTASGLVID